MRDSSPNLLPPTIPRGPTLAETGAKGVYWLVPIVFLTGFTGALWAPSQEPESKNLFAVCALILGSIAAVSILFPILRVRERNRAFVSGITHKSRQLRGIYIPHSKTVHTIFKIMTPILGIGAIGLTIAADNPEARFKGALASVCYAIAVGAYVWRGMNRRLGILIAPEGVVFSGMLHSYFAPWECIGVAKSFMAREKYSTSKAIGLLLVDVKPVETTAGTRQTLAVNLARQGFQIFAHESNLLAPADWVAAVINFHLVHPNLRHTLDTEHPALPDANQREPASMN